MHQPLTSTRRAYIPQLHIFAHQDHCQYYSRVLSAADGEGVENAWGNACPEHGEISLRSPPRGERIDWKDLAKFESFEFTPESDDNDDKLPALISQKYAFTKLLSVSLH